MSTYVTFHADYFGKAKIEARTTHTTGAPLILEIRDAHGNPQGEITIFTGSESLTCALMDAINITANAHAFGATAAEMEEAI